MCAVLPVLMQHYNIADRKGMPLIICRVVYIEFLIDRFQCCALRPPLQLGKFANINQVVILRLNGIEIVFYNSLRFKDSVPANWNCRISGISFN